MKMEMTIDVSEVLPMLNKVGKGMEAFSEPLEESANYMQNQAVANFPAKGKIMSSGWKPLAKSTKDVKQGKVSFRYVKGKIVPMKPIEGDASNTPMMVRTGLLKGSFSKTSPVINKNRGYIQVYNPVSYGIFHQWGTSKMPQRVLLKIARMHETKILKIFSDWLARIITTS